MVRIVENDVYLINGKTVLEIKDPDTLYDLAGDQVNTEELPIDISKVDYHNARKSTMSYKILTSHNRSGDSDTFKLSFDVLASHDITYVGIIQTARASGLKEFPVPYVLTNCHNSLCAVGGTINEDDHVFGLSAAQTYGGIYVPAHQAVIHQYMREMMTSCGSMVLGSDSHTRYGALGAMGIGEGGPEVVKQLLLKTYDLVYPKIIAVYLHGRLRRGVGSQDVALSMIGAVFKSGFVKDKILEFVGPGIANLSVDFRNGIDVMTTETGCLSSIWLTDDKVKEYYWLHGRPEGYSKLEPGRVAYYDGMVIIDLSKIEPMIAFPFHPSNVYTIAEVNANTYDILRSVEEDAKEHITNPLIKFSLTDKIVGGKLKVDQAIVAGCAGGTFENLVEVASILQNQSIGNDDHFALSVYPASQPIYINLLENGLATKMLLAGLTLKSAFCGPCFGVGDIPGNGDLSIRHTTRNFPNREGSKPGEGQMCSVALMDARSIAATAVNGALLTSATEIEFSSSPVSYKFDRTVYANRVYNGFGRPRPDNNLKYGPNIADWPKMSPLPESLLLRVACVIFDPVTTTDELIPSGESSSYRSNPAKLAEFTLSQKDPQYVRRAKEIHALELERLDIVSTKTQDSEISAGLRDLYSKLIELGAAFKDLRNMLATTGIGTTIYAQRPGDGSAREQAASSQRVLGGWANIANEYATKRYRSNLINWGLLPFTMDSASNVTVAVDDFIFIPDLRNRIINGEEVVYATVITPTGRRDIVLGLRNLTTDEREIILEGGLINYFRVK